MLSLYNSLKGDYTDEITLTHDRLGIPIIKIGELALKLTCQYCHRATSRDSHCNKDLILCQGFFCSSCLSNPQLLQDILHKNKKHLTNSKISIVKACSKGRNCLFCVQYILNQTPYSEFASKLEFKSELSESKLESSYDKLILSPPMSKCPSFNLPDSSNYQNINILDKNGTTESCEFESSEGEQSC